MSPEILAAWIGLPTTGAGLVYGVTKGVAKAVRAFDRVAKAVSLIETRSVQLEHNGGSSMRDDALAARVAAEAARATSERLEERLDRHIEQHSNPL